jgi:hypothetical protein
MKKVMIALFAAWMSMAFAGAYAADDMKKDKKETTKKADKKKKGKKDEMKK